MHPFDTFMPLVAEGGERYLHLVEGLGASAYEPVPMHRTLDDEARVLEDGDVSLDRSEGHRVLGGEVGHRVVPLHGPGDDVAPRRVGERPEASIHHL